VKDLQKLLQSDEPILALAPMQDVTDLRFMRLISEYGNADVYFTEYFRVLPESRLDPQILSSITQNPTGRPVIAQMIGNDIAPTASRRGDRSESRLPGADRVSQVRRRPGA
jgi:tRNA-dihydrouridine synthase